MPLRTLYGDDGAMDVLRATAIVDEDLTRLFERAVRVGRSESERRMETLSNRALDHPRVRADAVAARGEWISLPRQERKRIEPPPIPGPCPPFDAMDDRCLGRSAVRDMIAEGTASPFDEGAMWEGLSESLTPCERGAPPKRIWVSEDLFRTLCALLERMIVAPHLDGM